MTSPAITRLFSVVLSQSVFFVRLCVLQHAEQ